MVMNHVSQDLRWSSKQDSVRRASDTPEVRMVLHLNREGPQPGADGIR